jgi:DNA ligase-1
MNDTPFARLADLSQQLEQTSKRLELTALLADFLRTLSPEEVAPAVRLIIGQVFPEWDERVLAISWRAVETVVGELTDALPSVRDELYGQAVDGGEAVRMLFERARRQPPSPPPLTILEVFRTFEQIAGVAGKGAQARKEALLRGLLARASAVEAKHLSKVVYQEMRHGVSEGLMLEAIVRAAGVKSRLVQRANQVSGDLGAVAFVALTKGEAGLKQAGLRLFRPLKPMLAQTADDMAEVFALYPGQVALEYKLDGARVQIHRRGGEVRIYSRQLADVTGSLPDVVGGVRKGLAVEEAILEGEVIAVDAWQHPLPFQHLMRRFRRKHAVAATIEEVPVQLHLFDALYVGGRSLLDSPNRERWQALEEVAGGLSLVRRLVPQTPEEGQAFAEAAYRDGHEGVMAKDLDSAYTPGIRGKSWLKLKHTISLDMVIVAADWGYGRRHGWLSNYHLAVRDEDTGQFRVIGKTFKGLTDAEFQAMTGRLLALERSRTRGTVFVQPQVVVEVLFNEVQESSQYEAGLTLRFARISRLREDKAAAEADTLQTLRRLYERQFDYKGRLA